MDNEWLVILNPTSGGGQAKKEQTKIMAVLDDLKFSYRLEVTTHEGHAIQLTRELIGEGYHKIMGIGGDGTVNEILNGIFSQTAIKSTDITFGFLPVGTGNDWIRSVGIPRNYPEAARALKTGNFFFQDVGKVTSSTGVRYFANVAGFGYDAFVCERANRKFKRRRRGKLKYLLMLLGSLLKYRDTHVKLLLDGEPIADGPVFSLNAGIGKYNGNGMMQVPHAIVDDYQLSITVIHRLSKWQVLRNTNRLYEGTHIEREYVTTHQGQKLEIHSQPVILAETDGEMCGETPCTVEILPRAFRIISPRKNHTDFTN